MEFYLLNKFNTRDIKAPMLSIFPIKEISEEEQSKYVNIVNDILNISYSLN